MKMNLPNKLTLFRVFCIPVFLVLFLLSIQKGTIFLSADSEIEPIKYASIYRLIAAIIFVVASITDYFDGMIARKYNLVTDFGKLMDPLADKILVVTALMLLSYSGEVNFICVLIVVLRELIISSIRLLALEKGVVIAASYWGKLKTATQMVSVVLILFNIYKINFYICLFVYGLFYISTAFCVVSLIDYIAKSVKLFKN